VAIACGTSGWDPTRFGDLKSVKKGIKTTGFCWEKSDFMGSYGDFYGI